MTFKKDFTLIFMNDILNHSVDYQKKKPTITLRLLINTPNFKSQQLDSVMGWYCVNTTPINRI